ncbi:nSTAND1 domain-containing NTPase [Oligosphaera ethanolica]|uniref:WD40 repeat protein n=1 Tax=Oligosphaera ethanolica TaxID=760260 RepID=A0AAE3VHE1_9BACT|nr:AAA family ATPase [Oligosphaera ethanolica]MDQ0290552.1 WD40 repeat protein [Oligosphaera ethanolica]
MKTIRIFISSPGDVAVERDKARKVVEGLQKRYAGRLRLETVLWEDLPLGADKSFQAGIDQAIAGTESSFQKSVDLLLSEKHCVDIAVFILWSRLGSPLGAAIRKPDGTPYRSGTEREFDLMLAARALSPDNLPEILVYVRQDDRRFKAALQETPTDKIEEMLRQHRLAEQFIREQFHDAATGSNLRAYHTFPEPNTFAERLKTHLRSLLDGIVMDEGLGFGSWEGSPYRGLEVFRSEHAPIFFGRDEEVCDILERLRAQAAAGCAFLLLVGASGSGKSSLARAGVLPALETDNPDETVAEWRTATLTPGECTDGLCRGLARTLLERIPELRGDDDSLDDLEQALRDGQGKALNLLLKRACAGDGRGPVRLVLLVDQFEELFTHPAVTEAEVAAFLAALQALAVSGCVWVLATVRSDFYDRCQRLPTLMAMKGERGQIDLLPPEPSDIHRIITGPAMLAGVAFEKNVGGESLDQRILNDAVGHPEALPLLEFALAQLYEARTAEGLLTFAAYEKLGGVEGAIGSHAEAVFAAQPEPVRAAFGPVFQALVALDESDEARPVRRRVALDALATTPERRQLVEALLAARLLSSDRGEVFVAHEALLRRWERAVQWIDANRDRLRVRDRIAARLAEGAPLAENDPLTSFARHHLAEHPDTFDPAQRDYIATQLAQLDAAIRRRERIRRTVVAGLSALTFFALTGGAIALWQWREADAHAAEARRQTENATEANRANLENLRAASNADLASAIKAWQEDFDAQQKGERAAGFNGKSRWHEAVALLVRALERDPTNEQAALWLYDTIRHQGRVRRDCPLVAMNHESSVCSASFSPDGTRVVTASWDDTARVWDAASGKPIGEPLRHEDDVYNASFSPDGTRVVTASHDKTARVWDAASGKPIGEPLRHAYRVVNASFSPDGTRVVTASWDDTARVWDAASGKPIGGPMRHEGSVRSASFSPDGTRVVTASDDYTARVWDAASGKPIGEPLRHEDDVNSASFSPDGTRVVTASQDNTARVWDAASGRPIGVPLRHERSVCSASFSPDGTRVVTASHDKTARVWDAASGKPIGEPLRHAYPVVNASFSPDGTRVVTASWDDTARVWDAASGKPIGEPLRHENWVYSASFSPDGRRVVTASRDKTARVWDAASGKPIGEPLRHDGRVLSASFSPDGTRVVTASQDKTARVWDAASGKPIGEPLSHENWVNSASFSPDGTRVVTASWDKTARMWDAASGRPIGVPLRHERSVCSASFSPDGTQVVTASSDGTTRVWNTASGKPIGEPLRHESSVLSASFSPDGTRVVTASWDDTARVWDAASGKPIGEPLRHESSVLSASFSPDGTRVVTASWDDTARVWDAASGKPIGEPLRHESSVLSASFSPDGTRVVTASQDNTARVWDAASSKPIGEPLRHEDDVTSASFSPDGTRVVTASVDRTAQVWDAAVDKVSSTDAVRIWASGVAGLRYDPDGKIQEIPHGERLHLLLHTRETLPKEWRTLADWLLDSRPSRLLSPGSHVTVRQIAERERDTLLRPGIESALRYDPTIPFARTLLAGSWVRENRANPASERDPGLPLRAVFMRNYDIRLLGGEQSFSAALSLLHAELQDAVLVACIDCDLAVNDPAAAFDHLARLVALRRQQGESLELADALLVQGGLAAELKSYAEAVAATSESLAIASKFQGVDGQFLSDASSLLCWVALLTGKHKDALEAGEKAVALLAHHKPCSARMKLAHAYLLTNQFEKAKTIHEKYARTSFLDGRKWNDEARSDFKLLREAGQDHPDMKRIEALLGIQPAEDAK